MNGVKKRGSSVLISWSLVSGSMGSSSSSSRNSRRKTDAGIPAVKSSRTAFRYALNMALENFPFFFRIKVL